jgi:hypothetical protein
MAEKSPGARADKHPAKARKRTMGKPVRERLAKQAGTKSRPMEIAEQDVSGHRGGDGGAMERVRIVFASDCKPCPDCGEPFCLECQQHYADCKCPGPSNAEDDGWKLVEENGTLYGIRPLRA